MIVVAREVDKRLSRAELAIFSTVTREDTDHLGVNGTCSISAARRRTCSPRRSYRAVVVTCYLFVGDVASGKSLAGLYSLVATCESRGINPFDYLADVLARVQDHPANAINVLLPGAWAAAG